MIMNSKSTTRREPAATAANPHSPLTPGPHRPTARRGLSLTVTPLKAMEARSTDPYNTSGSFDRTKNWARVGKR